MSHRMQEWHETTGYFCPINNNSMYVDTNQPFLVALVTFLVQLLDSNDHPCAWSSRGKCLLIDPTLEDRPKPTLAEHTVRSEVSGGSPELIEGKGLDVCRLQNLILATWGWQH